MAVLGNLGQGHAAAEAGHVFIGLRGLTIGFPGVEGVGDTGDGGGVQLALHPG